jgi:hypothetical protein
MNHMRRAVPFAGVAFLISLAVGPACVTAAEPLVLRVESDGWGDADADDVRAVLTSAGGELLRFAPPPKPIRIRIRPVADTPQVDYKRATDGELTVRLAVKDRQWAQFAYQFGHELAHVVCHYERRIDNKFGAENQWFEEAVGEAASLFVLTRMAETWKTKPPYRNWKSYAPSLADYATTRAKGIEAPAADGMAAWFTANRAALRADPYLRDRNCVVASHLARMLEAEPEHWAAFGYLNLGRPASNFESYIENWYFSVPKADKPFVKRVADLLGVTTDPITKHAGR